MSVPTNIVEGYGRRGDAELKRFLLIALGSLAEVKYLLDFSEEIGFLTKENHISLRELRSEVGNLLWKFCESI